jgi:hypothetical protein
MASPPPFHRSISSSHLLWASSSREQNSIEAAAANAAAPGNGDMAVASSSSTHLLHPHAAQASNVNATQTSARSRTRSVGADGHSFSQHRNGPLLPAQEPSRGPGTPDITLDPYDEIRGRKDTNSPTKSRLSQTDTITNDLTRKRSSSGK